MTDRNLEFPEPVNYEALIELDNRIEETEAKIKALEDEITQLKNENANEHELAEAEKMLRYFNGRLELMRQERADLLGYIG